LHDVSLVDLFSLFLDTKPQTRDDQMDRDPTEVVRLLVRRAGVRHFIVNSVDAADRLRADLRDDAPGTRIDVLFLPVLPRTIYSITSTEDTLRIGHFGSLRPGKHPDRLIAACDLIVERRPLELVLAGYGVAEYVRLNRLGRGYVRTIDSPSDLELQEAMARVDCAVQLRYPDHGESSGVVNQLLALRKPVVCARSGSFTELGGAVYLVDPNLIPSELASAIEHAASAGWPDEGDALGTRRSPTVFEGRLRDLMSRSPDAIPRMGA